MSDRSNTASDTEGNAEQRRIEHEAAAYRRFGPYLSERQWGTVREDYSAGGDAWGYFPHEHARSRAYRWGEDGLAGISDLRQLMCLSIAVWNERDPILKERLFGLTNAEGNHGEDVKEVYYYLDATPSHAYLKYLYKYPQRAYPYAELLERNARAGLAVREVELEDTDAFLDDRYFDVFVEWAKAGPSDIVLRITAHNRGPDDAPLHVLPHLWFRNTWSWDGSARPSVHLHEGAIAAEHPDVGRFTFRSEQPEREALFTDNDSNAARLWGAPDVLCAKDAFHDRVIDGRLDAVSALHRGTKACFWDRSNVPARGSVSLTYRLTESDASPVDSSDAVLEARRAEADAFYAGLGADLDGERARVLRQSLAGMIWGKQRYRYDVRRWMEGDSAQPPPPKERADLRNGAWEHLHASDVLSMPDKWEYPWFAAWDLAFQALPFGLMDLSFAKEQLLVLTREWYLHPNGQLPAYEWKFEDVNPPVHAWAGWKIYKMEEHARGAGDRVFLEALFHKLLLNFTWWVNRKDAAGRNIFQGGFLGLDNIGVFDRSSPLPTGGHLDQSDGTAWMAAYCLQLMRIALELSRDNPVYEELATKFFEHFLRIAQAMTALGGHDHGLWDETDGFFYDALHLPNGQVKPLKLRSMVGLLPLFAVEVLEPEMLEAAPAFAQRLDWLFAHRPDLAGLVSRWSEPGRGERRLLSLLRGSRMKRLFRRMLDETEFLSPHGIRAMSRAHHDQPYVLSYQGGRVEVRYEPAEANGRLFGGNSNWRGPVWFPVNFLLIDAMHEFHRYYGDDFRIECPTGSGHFVSIAEAADEVSRRLVSIFLPGPDGARPFHAHMPAYALDPHFKDHLHFHEYFHGDTGRGEGASHQTGWTGLVANLILKRGMRGI